ncbi:MAG: amidase [Chloroflexi bacterium]|nr:amidase [Chloroflexota bacterium]
MSGRPGQPDHWLHQPAGRLLRRIGLKPGYDRVSKRGCCRFPHLLSTVGYFTQDVAGAATIALVFL